MPEDRAVELIQRYDSLKSNRANWETLWDKVLQYVIPRRGSSLTSGVEGLRQTDQIYDSTACEGLKIAASGLFAFLCPPSEPWFSMSHSDRRIRNNATVKKWLAEVTSEVEEILQDSNFYQQIHEAFLDLESTGTATLFSEEDPERPGHVVFNCYSVYDTVVDANYDGFIDTMFRRVLFTPRQAAQKFGEENLPEKVDKALRDPKKVGEKFEFIHFVGKNEAFDPAIKKATSKNYTSLWLFYTDKEIVRESESGYDQMPYHVARMEKGTSDNYGRSSSIRMLPTIALVNRKQKDMLRATEKAIDPPVLLPNDGSISSWNSDPGSINYWNGADQNSKPEYWQFQGNLEAGWHSIERDQNAIMEGFNAHLFNALAMAPRTDMTATEVHERIDEKLTLLAPMIGRLQRELFQPIIMRVFGILKRTGKLPTPPPAVENQINEPDFEIKYLGKLAQALRQMKMKGFLNALNQISGLFESRPDILDNINLDEMLLELLRANSTPERLIQDESTRDQIREARRQEQEAMAQMEAADSMSQSISRTSKRPEEGSPAEQAMEGM